jgi:hypothetical protein
LKKRGIILVGILSLLLAMPALATDCPCTIDNAVNTASRSLGDVTNVETWQGQTFIAPGNGAISGFKFRFNANVGSPTGNVTWSVYGDNLSQPGLLIGSGSFTPTISAENTVTVTNGPVLNSGALYWITLSVGAQGTNNRYTVGSSADATSTYAGGVRWQSTDSGATWTSQTSDLYFIVTVGALVATSTPVNTSAPTDTPTPVNTSTPTITPSPTPDLRVVVTASSGNALMLERSTTFGDVTLFAGECVLGVLLVIIFAFLFFKDRIRA